MVIAVPGKVPSFLHSTRSTLSRLVGTLAMSARHYDHGVLHGLGTGGVFHPLAGSLDELVNFCSVGKLKATAYTGSAGLAFALWRAGMLQQRSDWCSSAAELAHSALSYVSSKPACYVKQSLHDGVAGVILVNCLIAAPERRFHLALSPLANPVKLIQLLLAAHRPELHQLLSTYNSICSNASEPSAESDEFLYGRAGTLFGALLLRRELGRAAVSDAVVGALVSSILASGRTLAAQLPVFRQSQCPLAYVWPPGPQAEPYLGAAHGLMGILYVLLHCQHWLQQDAQAVQDVKDSLRFVLSCECDAAGLAAGSGGHYPALMKLQGVDSSERHVLVHWCHGAPGAIYLFSKAYEVFKEQAYLDAAVRAGDLVWQQGLLKKGPGLCHGVAGNAYALLRLWKATQDPAWLRRGQHFAAFVVSPKGSLDWKTPDHPTSLFEGAAGGICLIAELMAVEAAAAGSKRAAAVSIDAPAGEGDNAGQGRDAARLRASALLAFPLYELGS